MKIGVTDLSPERACGVETATDLRCSSFILSTSAKDHDHNGEVSTHLYVDGKVSGKEMYYSENL